MGSLLSGECSTVFRDTDPLIVSDYVNSHIGRHGIDFLRSAPSSASLNHRKFNDLDICRISYGSHVRVTSPALETIYHLQVLLRGRCLWRSRKVEQWLVPGQVLIINPDDEVDLTYSEDCEKLILKIPVATLNAICEEHRWGYSTGGVRFSRTLYDLQELEGFNSLLGMICLEAETVDSLPQVQRRYTNIVGVKLLTLFNSNVCRRSSVAQVFDMEHLLDFIENNLKSELCSKDLAKLIKVSPRSLYALFERALGMTPKHYIRQRRLTRINACLSDPNFQARSLTEIALDYGFSHLGRFPENYRQQFGELPSETLKRFRTNKE